MNQNQECRRMRQLLKQARAELVIYNNLTVVTKQDILRFFRSEDGCDEQADRPDRAFEQAGDR